MDRQRSDAEKGTKVFVGNIPPDTESSDLRDFFRDYGLINDAWVARKPPGFGFVFFDSDRDARDAVRDLSGKDLRGNRVRIELSKPRGASPRKSHVSRGDSRDESCGRSPPRRSSGSLRSRSKSPSPKGASGGGRSPRARSPYKDRDKRESARDSGRDRPERSRSPRRGAAEDSGSSRTAAAKRAEESPPARRRSRSREKSREKSRKERSRS